VWVLCRHVWVTKACQLFLVPSQSSSTPLYPSKCYELGNVPDSFFFRCFLLGLTFESFKELGVRHNFRNFGIPYLGVPWKMTFGCSPHGKSHRILQGKRWWFPLSLDHDESWEFVYACGSFMHWKCSNYALSNLLFGLCKSIWIIDLLVTHLVPIPKLQHAPLTLEVLQIREGTIIPFIIFIFKLAFESFKEFKGASILLSMSRQGEALWWCKYKYAYQ